MVSEGASGRTLAVDRHGSTATPLVRRVAARPVLVVAALSTVVAVLHLLWVSKHRGVGGLGVDETGFSATALRFERALTEGGPLELVRSILEAPTAPVVPLLSLPFLAVAGPSVTAVLGGQAVVSVAVATAIAGLSARLAGASAGLVAGVIAAGVPVHVVMARYVQFASAVSATLCLLLWALVASDRGTRRGPMVAAGAALGLMLVSRSMAVAFVPAVVAASAVLLRRDRRVADNAVLAISVAAVVAAPWWVSNWSTVAPYLFSFGYGRGAEQIEEIPVVLRLPIRLGLTVMDIRPLMLVPFLVGAVLFARRHHRTIRSLGRRRLVAQHRPLVAVSVAGVVAFATLLSSSNSGSWFQAPVEALGLVVVAAAGVHLARPARRRLTTFVVAVAVANVLLISVWTPGASVPLGGASASAVLFAGTEQVQAIDFAEIDERFAVDASWGQRRRAEREWAAATSRVARAIEEIETDRRNPVVRTFVGEIRLLNASTLDLWYTWRGERSPPIESVTAPEAARSDDESALDPVVDGSERVLVSIRAEDGTAGARVDPRPVLRQAELAGWRTARRIALPAGGTATILRHEDRR